MFVFRQSTIDNFYYQSILLIKMANIILYLFPQSCRFRDFKVLEFLVKIVSPNLTLPMTCRPRSCLFVYLLILDPLPIACRPSSCLFIYLLTLDPFPARG